VLKRALYRSVRMANEWFRSPDWSHEGRDEFERRLSRARPDGRAQYLYLKALALRKHGGEEQRRGARELNERVVNDPGAYKFEVYYALLELAQMAEEDGSREEAVGHLRRAVASQPERFEETELMLAEILVASDDPECWREAAALVERAGSPAHSPGYRCAVVRARLAARAGDDLAAAANARTAIAEAVGDADFTSHSGIELSQSDSATLEELQELAEHMTTDEFLAWQEDQWRALPRYQDEAPILEDLWRAGVRWPGLGSGGEFDPLVVPVLLSHLEKGGYPDDVMEWLARSLAVKAAAPHWTVLANLYAKARGPGEKDGLAIALSEAARPEHFDALVRLLRTKKHGKSRIFFVRTVKRLSRKHGKQVLAEFVDDPVLGPEIRAALKLK